VCHAHTFGQNLKERERERERINEITFCGESFYRQAGRQAGRYVHKYCESSI
jgi:hypothetical protein